MDVKRDLMFWESKAEEILRAYDKNPKDPYLIVGLARALRDAFEEGRKVGLEEDAKRMIRTACL